MFSDLAIKCEIDLDFMPHSNIKPRNFALMGYIVQYNSFTLDIEYCEDEKRITVSYPWHVIRAINIVE